MLDRCNFRFLWSDSIRCELVSSENKGGWSKDVFVFVKSKAIVKKAFQDNAQVVVVFFERAPPYQDVIWCVLSTGTVINDKFYFLLKYLERTVDAEY